MGLPVHECEPKCYGDVTYRRITRRKPRLRKNLLSADWLVRRAGWRRREFHHGGITDLSVWLHHLAQLQSIEYALT